MISFYDSPEEKKPRLPTPDAGPRPDKGPMKDSELQGIITGLIDSAVQYTDGELSPLRALATNYYMGKPFGNEEPGRSQVVITEVRDGVQAVLPSMLKVVFGADRPVEYRPERAETVAQAEQATDFVYNIFMEENSGFLQTLAVLKDGLVRRQGAFKWWWDDTSSVANHKLENVSQEQLEILAGEDEIEMTRIVPAGVDPMTQMPLYDVELTRTKKDGRARFAAVPPEELCYNREARSPEEATIIFHRTEKTHGELIAMGIDPKIVKEHGTTDAELAMNEEEIARNPFRMGTDEDVAGEANQKTRYIEAYARIDYDGDGTAELRKICTIGAGNYVVKKDPTDEIPFAFFCPDPEPHTMTGLSWADRLMDMQKVKSSLLRAGLDSLAASIFPRTWYKQGDAVLADILNTAVGAPIRTATGQGAVGEFAHTFTGREAFTALEYVDEIIERRTGQNKGAQGLDADALQSSTRAAVGAAVSASQAQQEMLVRIFSEMTLKPLFRGLLKLLVKHQPRAKMIKLRNQWVEVDPRVWNADMDVQVNVALGSGLVEEKVETLMAISDKQGEIIEKMGPQNPIVGVKQFRDTLAEIAILRGRKDADRYFKPITEEDEKRLAEEAANTPPPETPEMVLAKTEMEIKQMESQTKMQLEEAKTKKEFAIKQAELAMKMKEMQLIDDRERLKQKAQDDRERDKQASEIQLRIQEMEMKYMADINEQHMKAEIQAQRASTQSGPGESTAAPAPAPEPAPKSRRRRVSIERDEHGKIAGAVVEDHDVGSE